MKKNLLFVLISLLSVNYANSQNLLSNGNFELGGNGVGFSLNGSGYNLISSPFSGTTAAGDYAFTTDPGPMNPSNFIADGDHTTGTGKMMVIDGNGTGGSQRFWRAGNTGNGVSGLTIGTTYTFSYWIKSVSTNVTNVATSADIGIQITNGSILTSPASTLAPLPAAGWQKRTYTVTATAPTIYIEIWNNNTNLVGNDFAVDDFSLLAPAAPLTLTYSYTNPICSNDGAIVVYGRGGSRPYTTYNLSGAATVSNTTGIFTGLLAGNYTVTVTDSTPATSSTVNITLANTALTITPVSGNICSGSPITLTASGGSNYLWTASPTDPSLTVANTASTTVSPIQNTIYSVSADIASTNLIYNGDFSLGNEGFDTDYNYRTVTIPVGEQKTYGIVTNSQTWFAGFSNCTDHTGAGNMMVVDGSNVNAGNDKVWSQTIAVQTSKTYTFSYWMQTVATPNPAVMDVVINGVTISPSATAPNTTCTWTLYTYTWNSGAALTATIELFDRTITATGNDFAIDDLSFTTTSKNCNKSATVVINTITGTISATNPTNICQNASTNPTVTFTATTGGTAPYTFEYNINGGPSQFVISTGVTNTATITVSNNTSGNFIYNLVAIKSGTCNSLITGQSVSITINPKPIVSFNNVNLLFGQNAAQVTAFVTAPGTYNFAWTLPAGFVNPGNVPTFLATYTGAGPYPYSGAFSLTVTNTVTGCTGTTTGNFNIAAVGTTCSTVVTPVTTTAVCDTNSCTNLTANYTDVKKTTSYSVTSIAYAPVALVAPTGTQMCNFNRDDAFSNQTPIGFNFCFYGNSFSNFQVSSNMFLTFNAKTACSAYKSNWAITGTFPSTTMSRDYFNAIFFPMQDTDPRYPANAAALDQIFHSPNTVDIRYQVSGTAPCRKLVVNAKDLGLFTCDQSQGLQESQVILYENSNIIEIHIKKRSACTRWNPGDINFPNATTGGNGVVGLQNADGTAATIPPGRNSGNWTTTNEAWRFTPNGVSDVNVLWKNAGVVVGNTPTISVCPSATTTYTAEVTYNKCNNPYTLTATQTVTVNSDLTNSPINLSQPTNTFDLTQNTAIVLGALAPANYTISYHTTYNNALTATSPIAPANAFVSAGQTIYMYIRNIATGCVTVKQFTLFVTTCPTIFSPTTVAATTTQTVCLGGDPTVFTTNTTFTGANAISYVYFNTQQTGNSMYSGGTPLAMVTPAAGSANYDAPALANAGSLPNTLGTYWVYAIANPNPVDLTCRPYQEIKVIVTGVNTINLTSAVGTDAQTVCTGSAMTNITYSTIGATGASFSSLPVGVIGSWSNNVITISGTPAAGTYNYTVTLTGGCGTTTDTGTITVIGNNTITLTSAVGTNNQPICSGNSIVNITYNTTGATGATFAGFPAGIITTWAGNTVSISGSSTQLGSHNYTITLTGGCGTITATGTISVNDFILTSSTNNYTACLNNPMTNIIYTANQPITPSPVTFTPPMPGVSGFVLGNQIVIAGTPTTAGVYNYTILTASICGNITTTGTITVPTNTNTATIAANPATICPFYNSTLTVTGTPNTFVTISNGNTQFIVQIGAGGTGVYNTGQLSVNTTYYITSIVGNPAGCIKNFPPASYPSTTVSIIQGGCATSSVGQSGVIGSTSIDPICNIGDCRTLSASISNITAGTTPINDTTAYTVSSIPYCPQAPFLNTGPDWVELYPGQISTDDRWATNPFQFPAATTTTPAFRFCFFGQEYDKAVVGSNGVLSFNAGAPAPGGTNYANTGCPWAFSIPIPNANFPTAGNRILNAIYGVYQDIDISVAPPAGVTKSVNYGMYGTYPCRKFVMNTTNVPLYNCQNALPGQTYQIVLYEISNIIEVYVKNKDVCTSWNPSGGVNGGRGLLGIQNATGTVAYTPTVAVNGVDRNTGNWGATNEAWRFTPAGPAVPVTFNWFSSPNLQSNAELLANDPPAIRTPIGTPNNTTVTVCPTTPGTTYYYGQATYTICGVTKKVIKRNSIDVYPNNTSAPNDLFVCSLSSCFNLTQNTATTTAGFTTDYDVYYYTNSADQLAGTNALTPAQAACYNGFSGQTIYMSVVHNASFPPCTYFKQFKLYRNYISNATGTPQTIMLNSTPAPITASTGIINPNQIKFVYFNTAQTGTNMYTGGTTLGNITADLFGVATYTFPLLGTAGSLPNVSGCYYVYAISNTIPTDPTCRPYVEFVICVNPCETITNPVGGQGVCLNGNPTAFSVNTSLTAANSISFVYFNTAQTGNNMYSGGTPLASVTPVAAVATYDAPALGLAGSLPNTIGTYYVYAIANPPSSDSACRPYQEIIVNVINSNTVTLTSAVGTPNQTVCINTPITNITYNTTGATGIQNSGVAGANGLPPGVTATWAGNVVTISGTPITTAGTYNYTITTTGGCNVATATGIIIVNPNNTIGLSSAFGTDNQTICIGSSIVNITYGTSGATGATFTGLPTGVTGSWAGNVVTISGTPSPVGVYNYTVTLTGGCGNVTATGTITVTNSNTIALTSANNNQTVCRNVSIVPITFATTSATGATLNATLPSGFTGVWAANIYTITGSHNVAGTYPYTVTTTGGCNPNSATSSGTIIISPDNTITLTSAANTDAQTVCTGSAITNITYATTGATGVTVTGLPASGVTWNWVGNVVTISGNPTANINYTINLAGGCGTISASGTINVILNNTITLSSAVNTDAQVVCVGSAITPITYVTAGATGASTSGTPTISGLPNGVTGTWASNVFTISGTPTVAGVYNYTVTTIGGCGVANISGTITVTAPVSAGTISGNQAICVNGTTTFTSNGNVGGTWTSADPTIATVISTSGVITGAGSGTTTITYTVNGSGGCPNVSATRTVTVTAMPIAGTLSGNQNICIGDTTTFTTNGIAGGNWTSINPAIATIHPTSGLIMGVLAGTTTIQYEVTGTGGCANVIATRTVTVTAPVSAGTISGNQNICVNGTTTFTSNGNAGGTWTSADPTIATVISTSGVITGAGPGTTTITYTVNGSGGCPNVSATRTVTVTAPPIAGTLSGNQNICIGQTTTFTTNGNAGGNWTSINPAIATVNIASGLIMGVSAGTTTIQYEVIGTGGCANVTASRTVTVIPDNTITLTSAPSTINQTVCINTSIVNIVYNTTIATGATVVGLPAGLNASWVSGVFTISGSPSAAGIFNYTITTTGGCASASTTGIITVTPNNTITLTSAIPTTNQSVCVNTSITSITYATTTATGATVFGLPPGVTGSWLGNVFSITGAPNLVGTYNYTVTTTGGCNPSGATATGTIVVRPNNTITLNSALPTTSQTQCQGSPITDIVYTTTGATSVLFSGLPVGVSGTFTGGNLVTISGSPTAAAAAGVYNYTVTLNGGCGNITTTGSITVVTAPMINPNPTPLIVCEDSIYPSYVNDGVAAFNLALKDNEITMGNPAYTVTYYETNTNAQNCSIVNALTSPHINTTSPFLKTVYFCVTNSGATGCASYGSLQLIVQPIPIPTLAPIKYELCDVNPNPIGMPPVEVFNLSTQDVACGAVAGTSTAMYYSSQILAEGGGTLNILPNLFTSGTQTIWVRLQNVTGIGCHSIRSIDLVVNPLPMIATPVPSYTKCETSSPGSLGIGFESFDLNSKIPSIRGTQTNMTVTFHFDYTNANNGTNSLASPYINAISGVQTIWVRIENNITRCYSLSTMDLRVHQLPVPIVPPTPFEICDADQDGFSCVNLSVYAPQISAMPVTWYGTATDAESGFVINQLANNYCTANQYSETIFARVDDPVSGCYAVLPVPLIVTPAPVAPVSGTLQSIIECDDKDANNTDGITTFNLTTNGTALTNLQTGAASGYLVTYHTTLANATAINAVSPISNPTAFRNTIPNLQTIWIRITHIATGCFNYGNFDLKVNKPQPLNTIAPFTMCDNDTNFVPFASTTFDLMSKKAAILAGAPLPLSSYTIEFYPTYSTPQTGTAINNPSAFANNLSNAQTLGVVVTTPDGCKSYTSLTIRVIPIPNPRQLVLPAMTIKACDVVSPPNMTELLNVAQHEAYIRNGDGTLIFEYYKTLSAAQTQLPISDRITTPNAYEVGTVSVWIRIMNNQIASDGSRCYTIVEQPIIVKPLPIISPVNPTGTPAMINTYQVCETVTPTLPADGFEVFNLTTQTSNLLLGNPATSTFDVKFYLTLAAANAGGFGPNYIANPGAFTNTIINGQIIYVRVVETTTGCFSVGQFNILVNPKPVFAFNLLDYELCDDDGINDGKKGYPQNPMLPAATPYLNLSGYILAILGTQTTHAVLFYEDSATQTALQLATAGGTATAINPLTHLFKTGKYYVRLENILTGCFILDDFDVNIERLVEPKISGNNTICVDFVTGSLIRNATLQCDFNSLMPAVVQNPTDYKYEWYHQTTATGTPTLVGTYTSINTHTANVEGFYTVRATSLRPPSLVIGGCPSTISAQFEVKKSSPASIGVPKYFVTNAFNDNQTITVNFLGGNGNYEYSMDGGPWQSSTVFTNVPIGINNAAHTIEIRDLTNPLFGCQTPDINPVYTIDFPHYFTPNGDGVHDTWNVTGLVGQPDAKIFIFDRYGKLIKQISTGSQGWDGTFNGLQAIADDYWFTIDFAEQTGTRSVFKAHFALKR